MPNYTGDVGKSPLPSCAVVAAKEVVRVEYLAKCMQGGSVCEILFLSLFCVAITIPHGNSYDGVQLVASVALHRNAMA